MAAVRYTVVFRAVRYAVRSLCAPLSVTTHKAEVFYIPGALFRPNKKKYTHTPESLYGE